MNPAKLLFLIGAVICLPLYGFLCLTNLDPVTGFFVAGGLLTNLFYAALFLVPLLILLVSFVLQKKISFSISNSRVLGVLSFLLGGAMILSGVTHLLRLLELLPSGGVMFSVLLLTGLQIPISVLSGLVFLQLGLGYLRENIANRGSLAFLFPVIWSLITCVEMFRDYPQIAGMPERTLYLLCLLAFTLFLMGQSRILGDVDFQKGVRWVNAFGLCAGLFGLTMSLGELVAFRSMTLPLFDAVLALILSLYCVAFAVNVSGEKSSQQ